MTSDAIRIQTDRGLRWEKTRCTDETVEASIAGRADLVSAPFLEQLVAELQAYGRVVLDVSGLDVADATFLRFLFRLRRPGERAVTVLGARKQLKRLLDTTGLGVLFS
jgi:anti-anti-sigma regulatory factor